MIQYSALCWVHTKVHEMFALRSGWVESEDQLLHHWTWQKEWRNDFRRKGEWFGPGGIVWLYSSSWIWANAGIDRCVMSLVLFTIILQNKNVKVYVTFTKSRLRRHHFWTIRHKRQKYSIIRHDRQLLDSNAKERHLLVQRQQGNPSTCFALEQLEKLTMYLSNKNRGASKILAQLLWF